MSWVEESIVAISVPFTKKELNSPNPNFGIGKLLYKNFNTWTETLQHASSFQVKWKSVGI